MKHRINPIVDCVFKAMLGQESNKISLIHFLNAVLTPADDSKIKEVTILNPYNDKSFQDDKLSIVDVKARDEKGSQYQIEVQLQLFSALRKRMLYSWSSLYHSQLKAGDKYPSLKKTVSIWILAKDIFSNADDYHLPFFLYNLKHKLLLSDQLQIHIIQLPQWEWKGAPLSELDRWMYLFTKGQELDMERPPKILQTEEMKPAMDTLKRFSENEEDYDLYESRRLALMDLEAIKDDLREEVTEQVTAKVTAEMQAEIDKERKEKERLLDLLKRAGINPCQEI